VIMFNSIEALLTIENVPTQTQSYLNIVIINTIKIIIR